jgi:hypothetical protein
LTPKIHADKQPYDITSRQGLARHLIEQDMDRYISPP